MVESWCPLKLGRRTSGWNRRGGLEAVGADAAEGRSESKRWPGSKPSEMRQRRAACFVRDATSNGASGGEGAATTKMCWRTG